MLRSLLAWIASCTLNGYFSTAAASLTGKVLYIVNFTLEERGLLQLPL